MTTARNQTTAQSLGALFKSARDIMRKDKGLNGDLDRLPMLTWIYESMLREMRDAVGDSGEFYTPRAVVRLMVAVTDPRLGETVLDPASGTGGFLDLLWAQCSLVVDVDGRRRGRGAPSRRTERGLPTAEAKIRLAGSITVHGGNLYRCLGIMQPYGT